MDNRYEDYAVLKKKKKKNLLKTYLVKLKRPKGKTRTKGTVFKTAVGFIPMINPEYMSVD